MDEEMEDFIIEDSFSLSEFDPDYEFDASQFFDLTRPETYSEAQEAERWFESARSYPPSQFIVKLKWPKDIHVEEDTTNSQNLVADGSVSSASTISDDDIDHEVSSSEVKNKGLKHNNHIAEDMANAKTKSIVKSFKPRSSTLMKPTASHLAKQRKARNVHSSCRGRLQKPSVKVDERNLQNTPGLESQATKRQKLESGYLRKVAQLKHQSLFLHKISKKVGQLEPSSIYSRSKVTIPREPDLETAQRAQRRSFRSKNSSESGQLGKTNAHTFKARPLNRKILEAPSLPRPLKSMPQLPEFHVFHLKTTERAMQHLSANVMNAHNSAIQNEDMAFKRPNLGDDVKQEKCKTLNKVKACPPNKEPMSPTDNRLSENPPTELFKKLSLKLESVTKTISHSKQHRSTKGLKENTPKTFQHEFLRCAGKPTHCGSDRRVPEVGRQPKINRSVDIR